MILNKRWFFFVCLYTALIMTGAWAWNDEWGISLAIILAGAALLFGNLLLLPAAYRIDEASIAVYYTFGKTAAAWDDLNHIVDAPTKFPGIREYHIGYFKTRFLFWEMACIPKSKKATRLMERHCRKPIEKYG